MRYTFPLITPMVRRAGFVSLVAATLGVMFYAYLHFSENYFFPSPTRSFGGYLLCAFWGAFAGLTLYFTNRLLNKWVPWHQRFTSRFVLGYLSNFIITMTIALGAAWLS